MTFLSLFRTALMARWPQFLTLGLLAGLSNAAVLATINAAATDLVDSRDAGAGIVLLGLAIAVYSLSQWLLLARSAELAEGTVARIRAELVDVLQSAELIEVERLNRSEVLTVMGAEMQVISDGTLGLIIAGQALVLIALTTCYLAWLSFTALFLAVGFIAVASSIHLARSKEIVGLLRGAQVSEGQLMTALVDFVDGIKEVKLNADRAGELWQRMRDLARHVAGGRLRMRELYATNFVTSQVAFFMLTGTMVFVVPAVSDVDARTVVEITSSVLFIIGPITTVIGAIPVLQRVNAAADAVRSLEGRVLSMVEQAPSAPARPVGPFPGDFGRIALRDVKFSYPGIDGRPGFTVEPIDLDIEQGQVMFITGGNGSGKSTLLKLLTGLYAPAEGSIRIGGVEVTPSNIAAHRNMFSAIFANNHLFAKLYGIPSVDPERAAELIGLLEMDGKVTIADRAFSTLALSSGQLKRLAMIAALLEDRPIYVFDEWAADQDTHFRRKFYRELLPLLKTRYNKTIVAVTHDESYFDTADVRIEIGPDGRFRRFDRPAPTPVPQ